MNEIINELKEWRIARNLDNIGFDIELQVAMMNDEVTEVLKAQTKEHKAEEYCDIAVFAFNAIALTKTDYKQKSGKFSSMPSILRSLANMLEFSDMKSINNELNFILKCCENSVQDLGFDFKKLMLEKIKVINSRKQCPIQAKEWAISGAVGKWQKDKNQDESSLYKIDFELCRL